MTLEEQLERWVNGESIHNEEHDACCPDLSCCGSVGIATRDVRERFAKAHREKDEHTIGEMLVMFLGAAFPGARFRVARTEKGGAVH